MLNSERVDLLVKHILATAALCEDFTQRRLGPIHFLKYVYLADLAYAKRHEGQSFTGADWRFYHFGPWSDAVFKQLPVALAAVGARQAQIPSRYEGDFVRYGLQAAHAEEVLRATEQALPFVVANATARAVREHGSDTADLLRHVYLTEPMLAARPGEMLDLHVMTAQAIEPIQKAAVSAPNISNSQKKARAAIIASARVEMARRLSTATDRAVPVAAPRYDDVFKEGTAYLDQLAGPAVTPAAGELEFDESIWTSDQRREPEIP